jgi:hypothetical protein
MEHERVIAVLASVRTEWLKVARVILDAAERNNEWPANEAALEQYRPAIERIALMAPLKRRAISRNRASARFV